MKKALNVIGKIFSFLGVTLGMIFIALVLTITLICHGPSESAKELFATTILETGQLKFLANVFLSKEELQEIVDKNSLQDMDAEVDENLINTDGNKEKELIEIHNVSGDGFEGTMMVVNDPAKISLATTYPWSEYGKELGVIVDEDDLKIILKIETANSNIIPETGDYNRFQPLSKKQYDSLSDEHKKEYDAAKEADDKKKHDYIGGHAAASISLG